MTRAWVLSSSISEASLVVCMSKNMTASKTHRLSKLDFVKKDVDQPLLRGKFVKQRFEIPSLRAFGEHFLDYFYT